MLYTKSRGKKWNKVYRELSRMSHSSVRGTYLDINYSKPQVEDCLKKIIDINPLEEKSYCILMDLYISQGKFSQSVKIYESCKIVLKTELNVQPSLKTQQVFYKIPKNDHLSEV